MTTPSTQRKAGPYTGNGVQTAWPFTFKVFAAADIRVTVAAPDSGTETVLVLGTDYTVSLNSNQETSPGGTVTYLLPNTYKLTVTGALSYDQPLDLPGGGNFNPTALENQLDRMVMQTQQLAEEMVRAVKVPVTDDGTGELSGDLAQGILLLTPEIANMQAITADLANIDTVAGNIGNVNIAATNVADITNFADVYQGAKSSDPTLRNDGSALVVGDLYFSSATQRMRAYGSNGWTDASTAAPVTITNQAFNGNGSTTAFTLSAAPAFDAALDVYISGVYQALTKDYTVSGTTLTFLSAPPAGTGNIRVKILSSYAGGVTSDGSVTTAKLASALDYGSIV